MRVLVTGGAGFIGSHLVRALLRRGDAVRVLDDFSTGLRERLQGLGDGLEAIEGDIRDADAAARACAGADAVLHQAAQVSVARSIEAPRETSDINVTGLATVLDAARRAGARRFVLASSCAVYGDSPDPVQAESHEPRPASPYAASKLAGEAFVSAWGREGLPGIALRYFNVYGAGQRPDSAYAAVVPAFAAALRAGRRPVVHGDGLQSRDLVHVSDVVSANLAALDVGEGACGRAYNVGTGRATSVLDLARAMAAASGSDAEPEFAPSRPGDLRSSRADTRLAEAALGFRASVGMDEGLRLTLGA